MANKFMQKLMKMEGAVTEKKDVFNTTLKTGSPSSNFIYGKGYGLPFGYTAVLYGPTKGGKSVMSHMMIGWLHQNDPDALAIKFDTEYRADGQLLTPEALALYGIDEERLGVVQTNSPSAVFDQIEKQVAANCEAGAKLKLIIIDSINGVQGRREMVSESVEKQTIGDWAQTVQIGLKKILPVIRKYNIALVLICQIRAEMDQTEIMRGNKFKMGASFGLQHMAEYFMAVEPNRTVGGRKDIHGNEFVNTGVVDLAGKGEQTAMKIKVKMKDSNMGPKGRSAEFTFDFNKGLVNEYEEIIRLARGYGLVSFRQGAGYSFGEHTWKAEAAMIAAIRDDVSIQSAILAELHAADARGDFSAIDAEAASEE